MRSHIEGMNPMVAVAAQRGELTALPGSELLRAVLDSLTVGVVVMDRDLRYLMVNEQGAALNGLPVADHIGRRAADVVPDVAPIVEPFYRQAFETGLSVRQPAFKAMTPAIPGEARWWEANYQPLLDAEGDVVAVCATFSDTTEKVMAETKLEYTMQEMRTILDVLPIGLAMAHDPECTNIELNRAYKQMVGLPPDIPISELMGRGRSPRFFLNGKEVEREELPMRRAAATGTSTEAGRLDISFEDGDTINVLAQAAPLIIGGIVHGAVAAYVDVSDLVRSQEQLEAANRVQNDFLSMVSHELRTPLTMILGNAQLLNRGEEAFTAEERSGLIKEVYRESVGLSRIIDNLLLMSRPDRGERTEPVVLRHICKKLLADMAIDGPERCEMHFPEDLAIVLANPTFLEQVMRNLISNALKYSPSSEVVDLTVETRGHHVVFSVADRGPGIEASDREQIFEPFFRAEATASRSGMGIGLAVCKRVIEAMGGRIWAEAREGGGSIFSFELRKVDEPGA